MQDFSLTGMRFLRGCETAPVQDDLSVVKDTSYFLRMTDAGMENPAEVKALWNGGVAPNYKVP